MTGCFNPHPASQPDATLLVFCHTRWATLFQSSPGLSAGCNVTCVLSHALGHSVSMLTRPPAGRMQRATLTVSASPALFQSSPGLSAGCNPILGASSHSRPTLSFNPHPASQPDATRGISHAGGAWLVSILTRPLSRMQPRSCSASVIWSSFQSSPGLSAGCNPILRYEYSTTNGFQSSPGLSAGCNAYPAR